MSVLGTLVVFFFGTGAENRQLLIPYIIQSALLLAECTPYHERCSSYSAVYQYLQLAYLFSPGTGIGRDQEWTASTLLPLCNFGAVYLLPLSYFGVISLLYL
jgi:hypothetical protein